MVGLVPRREVGEVDPDLVAEAQQRAQERPVGVDPRHLRAGLRAGPLAADGGRRGPSRGEVRHDEDLPAAVGVAARLERLEQPAQAAVGAAARRASRAAARRCVPVRRAPGARLGAVPVDEHADVARAERDRARPRRPGPRRRQHARIGLGEPEVQRLAGRRRRGRRNLRTRQQPRDADRARGGLRRARGAAYARDRRGRDSDQRDGSTSPQLVAILEPRAGAARPRRAFAHAATAVGG